MYACGKLGFFTVLIHLLAAKVLINICVAFSCHICRMSSVWKQAQYDGMRQYAVPVCRQSWLDVGQLYAHLFQLQWWHRQVTSLTFNFYVYY